MLASAHRTARFTAEGPTLYSGVLLRHGWLAGMIAAAAALPAIGCHVDPCYPEVDPHGHYRVDVQDLYTAGGAFKYDSVLTASDGNVPPCSSGFDGIEAGAILEFQANGTAPDGTGTCTLVTADLVAAPSQITNIEPSADRVALAQAGHGDPLLYAVESVIISGCTGAIALGVLKGNAPGGIFASPQPGEPPPVVLYRYYSPSTGSCMECNDNFVAQLTKE